MIAQFRQLLLKLGFFRRERLFVLIVELNESIFLLFKGKLSERFDDGTYCNLSCHFDNLAMLRGCLIVAYYAALICWPNCKLSQDIPGTAARREELVVLAVLQNTRH